MDSLNKIAMCCGPAIVYGDKTQVFKSRYYEVYSQIDKHIFKNINGIYEIILTIKYITQAGIDKKIKIKSRHTDKQFLQKISSRVIGDVDNIANNKPLIKKDIITRNICNIYLYKKRNNILSHFKVWEQYNTDSYKYIEDILLE